MQLKTVLVWTLVLSGWLSACGGGGGDGSNGSNSPPAATAVKRIEITPPAQGLDFVAAIGTPGDLRKFVVRNTGTIELKMSPVIIGGTDFSGAGSLTGECIAGVALAAGASCTVSIFFQPRRFGVQTVPLTIGTLDADVPAQRFDLAATAYPAMPVATGQPVTLAGAVLDPATQTTVVPVLPDAAAAHAPYQWFPWSDYRPTGVYARPGEEISVASGAAPAGTTLQVLIGLWQQKTGVPTPAEVDPTILTVPAGGTSVLRSTYGGPVYVRAVNPVRGGTVSFQVQQGGTRMPSFLLGRDTHDQWLAALNAPGAAPYAEVVSDRAILTFHTAQVKAALAAAPQTNIAGIATLYDAMLASHDAVAGLDGGSPTDRRSEHPLHYTPHDRPGYYMFATNYRTAFCSTDCAPFLFTPRLMSDGWGPWHESGHMYQGAWEWNELVEVSVNLYSLTFQRLLGQRNRLIVEDSDLAGVSHWDRALQRRSQIAQFEDLGVFERLVMFWILDLAYGPGFYPALHKLYRNPATRPTTLSDNASYRQAFIVSASKVARADLRAYFSAWGLRATPAVDAEMQALGLPPADVADLLSYYPN